MDGAGVGLGGGHDEDVLQVDVCGGGEGEADGASDVVGCERRVAVVDASGALVVALETDEGELRLHGAGADEAHADAVGQEVLTHALAEGAHGVLRGAVDGAAGVDLAAGDGAEVDDMASAAGDHAGGNGTGDVEQAFDVGVDHTFPVVGVALVKRLKPDGQSGVIDERVDGLPFVGETGDGLLDGLTATDVEGERQKAALGVGTRQLVA